MILLDRKRLTDMIVTTAVSILLALAIVCVIGMATVTGREGQYQAPDIKEYFATLMQPDNRFASCCGDTDAYYTDSTDVDVDGTLIAIITDTRPDVWVRDDGSVARRPHMAPGTRIRVPTHKIRKVAIPVPFDHGLIFLNERGIVYCYEPVGGI